MAEKSRTIKINVVGDASGAVRASEDAGGGLEKLGAVAATAGVAIAAGLAGAFDMEKSTDLMNAQLGATGQAAATYGDAAGKLYSQGFGESMEETSQAIRSVVQNMEGMGSASSAELEGVAASAMNVATVMGEDVGRVSLTVGQMIKTGMAANAEEAFDILTRGTQLGVNGSEDLLDTFKEYPTQFRALGLSGQEAMGLLSQGLKAGARDSDTVADALKEFTLIAQGMSSATAEAYAEIGMSGKQVQADIAAGGERAKGALDQALERLNAVKNPADKARLAVALFGTKAEDLQGALYALDPSSAVDALGQVDGAAEAAGNTLNDNAATKIEAFKRSLTTAFVNVLGSQVLPAVEKFGQFVADNAGPLKIVGGILATILIPAYVAAGVKAAISGAQQAGAFLATQAASIKSAASTVAGLVASGVQWGLAGIRAMAGAVMMNAATILATGGIALIVAAIVGLAIVIYKNWDTIVAKTTEAWNWIYAKISAIVTGVLDWIRNNWGLLVSILGGPIGAAVVQIVKHWDSIKAGAQTVIDFMRGLPGQVTSALSTLKDIVLAPFKAAFNAVAWAWNNSVGKVGFQVPGWVPKLGGKGWSIPDIPMLADGGVISKAGLALVGEAGPELIQAGRGATVQPLTGRNALTAAPSGGGTVFNITVNNAGNVVSERDLIRQISQGINDALRRKGLAPIL